MRRVWTVVLLKASVLFGVSLVIYIYLDVFVPSELEGLRQSPVSSASPRTHDTHTGWPHGPEVKHVARAHGPQGVRGHSNKLNPNASLSYGRVAPYMKRNPGQRNQSKPMVELQRLDDISGPKGQLLLETKNTDERSKSGEGKLYVQATNKSYPVPDVPALPVCPPGIKLNRDAMMLSQLTLCAPNGSRMFEPEIEIWRYSFNAQCSGKLLCIIFG